MSRRRPFPAHSPITVVLQFTRWRVRRIRASFPSLRHFHEWLHRPRNRWRDGRHPWSGFGPDLRSARGTTMLTLSVELAKARPRSTGSWTHGNVPCLSGEDWEGYVRGPFGIRCGSRQSSKPWALIHLPSRLLVGEYRLLAQAKAAADACEAQPGIDWTREQPLGHLSWDQRTALRKIAGMP